MTVDHRPVGDDDSEYWHPPPKPPITTRRGPLGLWDRIVWMDDPDNQCRWATLLLRFTFLVDVAAFFGYFIANVVHEFVTNNDDSAWTQPVWFPWLMAAIVPVGVLGGGRRMWRGSATALAIVLPLWIVLTAWLAPHGFWVAVVCVPESLIGIALATWDARRRRQRRAGSSGSTLKTT